MRYDSKHIHELEIIKGPVEQKDKVHLKKKKFLYRQALGEALYVMVSYQPCISVAISNLSQYANSPAEIHYIALKNVFRYLRRTKSIIIIIGGSRNWTPTISNMVNYQKCIVEVKNAAKSDHI